MELSTFQGFEPSQTQLDFARLFIAKLKASEMVEVSTKDYKASNILAGLVVGQDKERLVQKIDVFSNFVRITRNEKGAFAFAPVVLDHVDRRPHFQDG